MKYGIKVDLIEHFSVVRESLDRIGILNKEKKILNPSCYLLHKKNKETKVSEYYIIHFKELFALDGKKTDFSDDDKARLVSIARLLENWGLVDIINYEETEEIDSVYVSVLPFPQKKDYSIIHKYQIGNKK